MAQGKVTFCLTKDQCGLVGLLNGLGSCNISSVTFFLTSNSLFFAKWQHLKHEHFQPFQV
jgi:hypothetical protein